MLGGHKHGEMGKVLGLEKISSVSSVCLRMKARVEAQRKIGRRAQRIEEELQKSQGRTPMLPAESIYCFEINVLSCVFFTC
jgi:hypothetical protein